MRLELGKKEKTRSMEKKGRASTVISILIFCLLPVVYFYLMEAYEHNPFAEVRYQAQWFNIFLFELFAWLLFFLFGSARVAALILGVLSMIFGLVNHFVMLFRSTPFVPWDFYSIKTAASVAGNYEFSISQRVIFVTCIFILLLIVSCFLSFFWRKRIVWRLFSFAAFAMVLVSFVGCLWDESFQNRHQLYPFLFTPAYMTKVNGMAVTFAMDLAFVRVEKPSGYNADTCEAVLEEYETKEVNDAAEEELPNLIVIMDEAFSELSVLGEVSANKDYMPFVHTMLDGQKDTVSGYLHMSVCGGNTANSEFEFLTGDTMAFLPGGSIPYQQYIKDETSSLAEHLAMLGYETYAMHPYYASGWERDTVYPLMGFSHSIFLDDFKQPLYVRDYVSDWSDMEKIKEIYENKQEGKPLFLFNVTMQNHGGYTQEYENFTNQISAADIGSPAVDQYLSLLSLTDEAISNLISYFEEQNEKTIVVFFGDHQPSATVAGKVMEAGTEEYKRYMVPFFIWANYDIEEQTGVEMSANYLGATTLSVAGVPTSAYQNYLLSLMKSYPVISAARIESTKEACEEQLLLYKQLQYYHLFE